MENPAHDADEVTCSPDPKLQTQAIIIPLRPPTAGPRSHRLDFLSLPYELRLDIYELLLLSPEPIIVSSSCRQLRVKVEPPEHQVVYLRAPRPRPRVVSLTHGKPHVQILHSCRQIEHEATPILYGRNNFVFGWRYRAMQRPLTDSIFRHLRLSTLLQLHSVTFRPDCNCDQWLKSPKSVKIRITSDLGCMHLTAREDHQQASWSIDKFLWQTVAEKSRVYAFCNTSTGERILI
ncbi:hypothetical protein CORC01_14052 [Colletotrichum orchidophilum]|uniref:F-box domain-containing protein n=1 Tax=Colletotrichum orchidophilum TaxID=1209926 RepID=A0A1G4ANP0_9PEZI|nr:uncharacterized protein CORC01_14052 [Colletotrichum orchidophilum]OHE90663.1 hypothetical protein CORC01_14052 [Colletotrichum orchidophilum]